MKKILTGALLIMFTLIFLPSLTRAGNLTIPDGVSIGETDVSGMTADEATAAVNDYFSGIGNSVITLCGSDETQQVSRTASELGLTWENQDVISNAVMLGKRGNVVERYKALKDAENKGISLELKYSLDDATLKSVIENDCAQFNVGAVNYGLKRENGQFMISDGQTGYTIDEDASVKAIQDYISGDWKHDDSSINLVIKQQDPEGSREELEKVSDVLGTFTTSYKTSGTSRCENIANGCKLASGKTIYPGEEYSVLDNITPFTEENGYYLAGSYLQGTVVESFGGGICQVSTTLYNAVIRAELEVTERHNHSMIINYVEPSEDAAIAENGGKNFKFINNTDYPVYIEGTTANKQITFTVYGVETRPSGRKVTFESKTLSTTDPEGDTYVTDSTQAVGYVHVQAAHQGIKAELIKTVTVDGVQESSEVFNNSTYQMVPRTISVGTSSADVNALAQINAAIGTGDLDTVKAVAATCAAQIAAGVPVAPVTGTDTAQTGASSEPAATVTGDSATASSEPAA